MLHRIPADGIGRHDFGVFPTTAYKIRIGTAVQATTVPAELQTGRVVVKICVDEKGDVISSSVIPEKSTTTDSGLTQKALKAAQAYKFAPAPGKGVQCGTITFDFKTKR